MASVKPARAVVVPILVAGLLLPANSAQAATAKSIGKSIQGRSITCIKGKITKKVNGANLRCPAGHKIKEPALNRISFSLLPSYAIGANSVVLTGTSSASLPLAYSSNDSSVCTVSGNNVQFVGPGKCSITATQSGSATVASALPVTVSFKVIGSNVITFSLPSMLLLANKTYSLSGSASSGLPLNYESTSTDVCTVDGGTLTLSRTGNCTVRASQAGSNYFEVAKSVESSATIVVGRVSADQPDLITGFQIKPIYVVAADGVDHSLDMNGSIAKILDEGNAYLKEQLGLQLPIDMTTAGYDIQFLKTKLSTAELMHSVDLTSQLFQELDVVDDPGVNRKNYTFFLDVASLKDGAACGYANRPGILSVVAIGNAGSGTINCSGPGETFQNWGSTTWVHENFHNFGVKHFDDSCDLMNSGGVCTNGQRPTIDKERTRYIGANSVGQDILRLRVWDGYTSRMTLQADCTLDLGTRTDGIKFAYCPTGTQTIGALTYCWQAISSDSLEEFINGNWVSLGSGNYWNEPWGPRVSWKCNDASYLAPWIQLTVNTPGVRHYRWIVNGRVAENLNVLWMQ